WVRHARGRDARAGFERPLGHRDPAPPSATRLPAYVTAGPYGRRGLRSSPSPLSEVTERIDPRGDRRFRPSTSPAEASAADIRFHRNGSCEFPAAVSTRDAGGSTGPRPAETAARIFRCGRAFSNGGDTEGVDRSMLQCVRRKRFGTRNENPGTASSK